MVIPGFGQFEGRARAARQGRNPQTGEALQIAASVSPAFSAGACVRRVGACLLGGLPAGWLLLFCLP